MTLPTLLFEAGFSGPGTSTYLHLDDTARGKLDTGTLAPDDVFADISAYVRRVSVQRGANRVESPILRYEAGTLDAQLKNDDRRFDPTNLAGPYVSGGVSQVVPMRAVRLRATWANITYHVWRGFADEWQVGYYVGVDYAETRLTATDGTKVLNSHDRVAGGSVGASEDSGARVTRILNSASWSTTDRKIATGKSTLQATTLDGNALAELQLVQDSEVGELYLDAEGRVVFQNRHAALENSRGQLVQALFGDVPVAGVSTTVNFVTNPSAETDLTGFQGGGFANPPVVTRSSTRAQFGTWSVLGTWATAAFGDLPLIQYDLVGLTVGKTYTVSVYAYVPTGSPAVHLVHSGNSQLGLATTVLDAWERISITFTTTSATPFVQIWPQTGSTTAGQEVYLDGWQCEEGATVTAYVDGTQTYSEWDGNAHASTSRRLPELPYADVVLAHDGDTLANLVRATRAGGAEQTAEDSASQTAYLTQTFERSDLLLETDPKTADWAAWILGQAKDPELRFTHLVLKPQRDPDNLFPLALGLGFGDRIRITRRPPGGGDAITRDVLIRGVHHEITLDDWVTTFTLQSANKVAYLILDHTTLGRLDHNQLAGF